MLDIQFIRDNPELVAEKSKQKGYDVDVTQLLGFDKERRELTQQVEELRQQRNELSSATKGQRPSAQPAGQAAGDLSAVSGGSGSRIAVYIGAFGEAYCFVHDGNKEETPRLAPRPSPRVHRPRQEPRAIPTPHQPQGG